MKSHFHISEDGCHRLQTYSVFSTHVPFRFGRVDSKPFTHSAVIGCTRTVRFVALPSASVCDCFELLIALITAISNIVD